MCFVLLLFEALPPSRSELSAKSVNISINNMTVIIVIPLMEQILHQLGPFEYCSSWELWDSGWCKISSINSSNNCSNGLNISNNSNSNHSKNTSTIASVVLGNECITSLSILPGLYGLPWTDIVNDLQRWCCTKRHPIAMAPCEPWSKLLQGGDIGDYIGNYYRGY